MSRRAFTLLETLLVIGIISVLLAMLFPAVQMVRATSERMQCAKNMNQIGLALHLYHGDRGRLPRFIKRSDVHTGAGWDLHLAWPVHILPYLDQRPLYQQAYEALYFGPAWANPPHSGYATVIRAYLCPTDSRLREPLLDLDGVPTALWSYVGNGGKNGNDGVLDVRLMGIQFAEIIDGLSNTLMLGERPPPDTVQSGRWYTTTYDMLGTYPRDNDTALALEAIILDYDPYCFRPEYWKGYSPGRTDWPCDRLHYWSMHPGGANFLFCDNSVRFIPYSAKAILPALASRANQDVAELPD